MIFLYFWAQRSGKLPYQRLAWRGDSCLDCLGPSGEDISGGWYEASNALLFGFPFHHTHTMMAYIATYYETQLTRIGQIDEIRDWVKVGADWTLKAHSKPDRLVAMRGIAEGSDFLWQGPPEEWTDGLGYSRNNGTFAAYVTKTQRGSEIVGQAAAGMAASYLTFKVKDPAYAAKCLAAAKTLYTLATGFPGSFRDGTWASKNPAMKYHREYYESSGYHDELALASAMMYKATNVSSYLAKARQYYNMAISKVKGGISYSYSWDDKLPFVALLLLQIDNKTGTAYETHLKKAFDYWLPSCTGKRCQPDDVPADVKCKCVFYTPKGLAISDGWGSIASSTNMGFLAMQYAQWLRKSNPADAYAKSLVNWVISQVNYGLGDNGGYSFMVGFGNKYAKYPLHISSFNSFIDFPMRGQTPFKIQQNFTVQGYSRPGEAYWNTPPYRVKQRFIVYGAVQAGPEYFQDKIVDDHWNFTFTEPAQDYAVAFLGATTGLLDVYNVANKASDCGLNLGWDHPNAQKSTRYPKYAQGDKYHTCAGKSADEIAKLVAENKPVSYDTY